MLDALVAIEKGMSPRGAAKQYGISLSTLRDRLDCTVTVKQNAIDRQALSDAQERQLARWILVQEAIGTSPTHYRVRHAAEEILQAGGIKKKFGKNWLINFVRQNPKVGAQEGKRIDL